MQGGVEEEGKEYSGFQFAGDSSNSMRSIDIVLPENVVFDKGV